MPPSLINPNPIVYEKKESRGRMESLNLDEYSVEPINHLEVFDHIKDILDPEHPFSLEELKVVTEDDIEVDDERSYIRVTFTPTVRYCSMSPLIGLSLRMKLMRNLPSRFKVDIRVAPGTLAAEAAVNKRLNDKERTVGAFENPYILEMLEECLAPTYG